MSLSEEVGLDDVIAAYIEACDAGDHPSPRDFISRWPQHEEAFTKFVAEFQSMNRLVTDLDAARASTITRPTPQSFPMETPLQEIDGYRLGQRLGSGGMAVVYEAFPIDGGEPVAMKVLHAGRATDPALHNRLRREAKAIQSVSHPSVVPLYGMGRVGDVSYLLMQLIDGVTLADVIASLRLQSNGWSDDNELAPLKGVTTALSGTGIDDCLTAAMGPDDEEFGSIARLIATAADALSAAHGVGVTHRDVKPSNLLLDTHGKLWLSDFGIASLSDAETVLTQTGEMLGTVAYMSPEQANSSRSEVDFRTDIYSLGATLYELVSLVPPYVGDHVSVLISIVLDQPKLPTQLNPRVPRPLEAIILKAMARPPEDRYQSASDLADDLRRFANGQDVQARLPGRIDHAVRWAYTNPGKTVATVMTLILLIVGVTVGQYLYARHLQDLNAKLGLSNAALVSSRDDLSEANAKLEKREETLRRNLYAADLEAAYAAFRERRVDECRRLLNRQSPSSAGADLRGFEWWLLEGLTRPPTSHPLEGHEDEVTATAMIPGTTKLLSVGHDGYVRKWDMTSHELIAEFLVGGELDAIAVSPNGATFVVGRNIPEGMNDVTLRNCTSGAIVKSLTGHEYSVEEFAFSPDGQLVASAGRYSDVLVHETSSGRLIQRLTTGSRNESLEFSHDGSELVALFREESDVHKQNHVRTWKVSDWQPQKTYTSVRNAIAFVLFPDGQRAAIADIDRILIIDMFSKETLFFRHSIPGRLRSLAVSPDGRQLAAGSDNGLLHVWQVPNALPQNRLVARTLSVPDVIDTGHGRLTSVSFSDSRTAVTTSEDGTILAWDLAFGEATGTLPIFEGMIATEIDPEHGFFILDATGRLFHVDANSFVTEKLTQFGEQDFHQIILADHHQKLILGGPTGILIVDSVNGEVFSQVNLSSDPSRRCRRLLITPEQDHLFVVHTNELSVIDTDNWRELQAFSILAHDADLSPDGQQLLLSSHDAIRSWDTSRQTTVASLDRAGSPFSLARFSHDGTRVVISHSDGRIEVVSSKDFLRIADLGVKGSPPMDIRFFDEGGKLMFIGPHGSLSFADVSTSRSLGHLETDSTNVLEFHFSEVLRKLVILQQTGPVSFWVAPRLAQ